VDRIDVTRYKVDWILRVTLGTSLTGAAATATSVH